jgi:hypothetical protein
VERWERHESIDGFEETWAVNHLAPLLLSLLLLPAFQPGGRIVNVSSVVHRFGRIDWEDLQLLRGYGAERAYYRSKLAGLMAGLELARRLDARRVAVLALAPGLVQTNFTRDFRGLARFWSQRVGALLFRTPAAVAEEIASLALDQAWAGHSGLYLSRGRVERPAARATDPAAQRRLWELSTRAIGLGPDELPAPQPAPPAQPELPRWIGACAAGELLGFGAAALWAWLAVSIFGSDPISLRARLGVLALMVLAGVCEGCVLGLLQGSALRAWFPGLRAQRWVLATAAVAALGWLLGMLPSTLITGSGGASASLEPPLPWVLAGSALFGAAAGAVFGFAQWLVLRRHAYDARRWISANALGWGIGLPWSYLAGSLADVSRSLAFALLCALIAGTLMGLSVALLTGRALARIQPAWIRHSVHARQVARVAVHFDPAPGELQHLRHTRLQAQN